MLFNFDDVEYLPESPKQLIRRDTDISVDVRPYNIRIAFNVYTREPEALIVEGLGDFDLTNRELIFVYDKNNVIVGADIIHGDGKEYVNESNMSDIRKWARGDFSNDYFDNCINKELGGGDE